MKIKFMFGPMMKNRRIMKDFQSMKHLKLKPLSKYDNHFMLQSIFKKQQALFENYEFAKGLSQEQLTIIYAQAIASEAQELMNHCNWKAWKQTKKRFNQREVIFEYIDLLHFVVNGLIALDVNAYQCMQYYNAKNKENHERKARKY